LSEHVSIISAIPLREPRVKWLWKSNLHPFCNNEAAEWCPYSDVETTIIEEAFQKKLPDALLDNYHIDFSQFLQITNSNIQQQRPVKRTIGEHSSVSVRKDRFVSNSISPLKNFRDISCFIDNSIGLLYNHLNLDRKNPLFDSATQRILVEKAAEGLIIESKKVGKQREGAWMAKQLLEIQDDSEQLARCCVRLYCMDSFLYRKLNEILRSRDDHHNDSVWYSKLVTLGPFALLSDKLALRETGQWMTVYRGANLPDDLIKNFHQSYKWIQFPAFTSTTRNHEVDEMCANNVLFCVNIRALDRSLDVAPYSPYPDEEKQQLFDLDFTFQVRSCDFDIVENKWIIHLSANELFSFDFFVDETLGHVLTDPDRFINQVVPLSSLALSRPE
jgi:hypothetical protein